MYAVRGTYEGVVYTVVIDPSESDPVTDMPWSGSSKIVDMLVRRLGDNVRVTPTGPDYILNKNDPQSVMAALTAWTQVDSTQGDVPEVMPPVLPDVVY